MPPEQRRKRNLLIASLLLFVASTLSGLNAQEAKPAQMRLEMPEAHFHHLHLNTTDPKAAIDFYTSKFDCERAKFAGVIDGVWAQKSWLLFNKVNKPPVWHLNSAVWHFGWGAEDMKATYAKHVAAGTKFFTPLTDISDIGGNTGAKDLFYFAYVQSPDNALIEIQHGQPSSLRPPAPVQRGPRRGGRMVHEISRGQAPVYTDRCRASPGFIEGIRSARALR